MDPLTCAQRFYAAALATDWETVASLLHPDFTVVESSGLPFAGTYQGLEGLQTLGAKVYRHFKRFSATPVEFTAGENSVAVLIKAEGIGRETGEAFETQICEWLHIEAGQILRITPFYFDEKLINTV